MSATKNKRAKYNCQRKQAHLTEQSAQERAAQWDGLEAYKCSVCPAWHVGHPVRSNRRWTRPAAPSAPPKATP